MVVSQGDDKTQQDKETTQREITKKTPLTHYLLASLIALAPVAKELGMLPETNVQTYNPTSAQLYNDTLYVRSSNGSEHVFDCVSPSSGGLECVLNQETNNPQTPQVAYVTGSQARISTSLKDYTITLQR